MPGLICRLVNSKLKEKHDNIKNLWNNYKLATGFYFEKFRPLFLASEYVGSDFPILINDIG